MSSLIEELQSGALNQKTSVTELLRKAKIVAVKLDLKEFLTWIENELNGYTDIDGIPEYRKVRGRVKAFNPYAGWIPIMFDDTDFGERISSRYISQKIAELEELAKKGSNQLQVPFSPGETKLLMRTMVIPLEPRLFISGTSVSAIVDSVRNMVLDWSLKLEQNGIHGEGMSFSKEDKAKAHSSSVIYNISNNGNLTGNIGSVSGGSQVKVHQPKSEELLTIKDLIRQIRKYKSEFKLDDPQEAALSNGLMNLDDEIQSKKPDFLRIQALLTSLRTIFETVSGNVIAQGILYEIAKHAR